MTDNRRDGYEALLGVVSSSPTSNAVALVERLEKRRTILRMDASRLIQSQDARIAELEGENARLLNAGPAARRLKRPAPSIPRR